jgi:hypothetical protein
MKKLLAAATLILALTAGCRIQVDKSKDGQDKNVKIETPLGGLHVRAGDTSAADVGLPAYPDAQIVPDKDGDKSADVHFGFGEWQFRVKAVHYQTSDTQDKVIAFYRKALGRYGDVVECQGDQPVGSPRTTREGLGCSDDKGNRNIKIDEGGNSISLRAGSRHHQHIFALDKNQTAETRFSLVELQLPEGIDKDSQQTN